MNLVSLKIQQVREIEKLRKNKDLGNLLKDYNRYIGENMVTDEEFTQNMANLSRIHNHIFKHKKQQNEKRNHWSD